MKPSKFKFKGQNTQQGMYLFLTFVMGILFSIGGGCRQAIYEIVKPATDQEGDPQPPSTFKDPGNSNRPSSGTSGPTARIEVIWEGQSVTQVKVNSPTLIRPTADTVDPDDLGKTDCPNPGITAAQYQIAGEASPVVDRGDRCEALSVPYTFKTVGDYFIEMTVTSNEGEKAVASMTLRVVNDEVSDFGGFTITANPLLAKVKQSIDFTGLCTTKNPKVIAWKFADGNEGEGDGTRHAYERTGSYKVEAQCSETVGNKRIWKAAVTVVVLDDVVAVPPSVTPPVPPSVPPPSPPPPPPPATPPPSGPNPPSNPGGGGIIGGGHKKCWFIFHCKQR